MVPAVLIPRSDADRRDEEGHPLSCGQGTPQASWHRRRLQPSYTHLPSIRSTNGRLAGRVGARYSKGGTMGHVCDDAVLFDNPTQRNDASTCRIQRGTRLVLDCTWPGSPDGVGRHDFPAGFKLVRNIVFKRATIVYTFYTDARAPLGLPNCLMRINISQRAWPRVVSCVYCFAYDASFSRTPFFYANPSPAISFSEIPSFQRPCTWNTPRE
jgi:hypothetical protein